jgi:PAS domain S-box-containing protein
VDIEPEAPDERLTGSEIQARPRRDVDIAAEHRWLERIVRQLPLGGPGVLQDIVSAAIELCRAASADLIFRGDGLSLKKNRVEAALEAREPLLFRKTSAVEEVYIPVGSSGALCVTARSATHEFCREDLRILTTLASCAAVALASGSGEARLSDRCVATEHLRDIVWLADPANKRFLYVNPACRDVRDQSPEQVCSSFDEWFSCVHPEDREQVRDTIMLRAVAEPCNFEYRVVLTNGTVRWVRERTTPLLETGHVAGICEDISDWKEAEAELQEASQRLRGQIEHSPMAIVEFDTQNRVTGWSLNAERMFGWTADEIVGKRVEEMKWLYEEDSVKVANLSRHIFEGEQVATVSRNRNYKKDGTLIWCDWYNSALLDDSGKVESLLSFVLDVTGRMEAEQALRESEERLDLAQRAGRIGTFESFVETGRVVWTETLERLFGLEPGTFEGRLEDWQRRVHPEDLAKVQRKIREYVAERRRDIEYEFRAILPGGEHRILYTRALIFYDPATERAVRLLGINLDVTEQRNAQAERERLLEESQREIERRLQVEHELVRSNEDLRQFAFSASHDLQEPLRTVAVYSQLLRRRYGSRLDDDADRFLLFVDQAAHRMETLLKDLLAYTRIATESRMVLEEVDSTEVLRSALAHMSFTIEATGAEVQVETLPPVRIWPAHLQQLFLNLIGNAIKYRAERAPQIRIWAERNGNFVTFAVRDNGIGIADQYQKQIFGIFKRLHTHAQYPGTGIGLAICQKIVERYGGRVWAESLLGEGSTFRFTLPTGPEISGNP